ncbi:MAG: hypothetical protein CfP315_0225 [Candidatus Improbicoccus pseudotrichonymphae]|uniref:Uncharacterized protein n=1 Tax=Candidatus Improbicoccus pseudotrichonymphae TaxID=3033792 RepID=A0AA48L0R0_9FIRM|nr:MAG: hypothetical protein CfP315_0225 [Candidatus Improbicoccus pseudotrichonymphae]
MDKKDSFVNFLRILVENEKVSKEFANKKTVEDTYEFSRKYLTNMEFDEYKEKILFLSEILKNKKIPEEVSGGVGSYVGSYIDTDFVLDVCSVVSNGSHVLDGLASSLSKLVKKETRGD